ncbi:uncharacterized protein LOC118368940 isoform X6 [Oncorhynchus keta]|uniref:uncharacterized protein LOC118368940 isoform X6 n=1 Tax=Oncorhynchus keta TaxID=8018 RepID=UPI00227C4BBC|nr:uncharacterized protein LOC118368940 isoform X6 [Oncorhynchus keta]
MMGFLCLFLSLTALQVEGFSGGGSSIKSQCGLMLPGNSFHGSKGQSSSSPYTVTVNQTTFQPGDTIQVTLSGTFTYKGFLLEAHEEGQNKAVGTFSLGSGTGIILVPCNGIASLRERKRYSRPMGCDVRDDPRKCTYISVTTYPPFIVEISAPADTPKGYLGIISEMLTNQIKFESVIVVYESGTFTVQNAFYNGATFINKTLVEVTDKELAYDPYIKILQLNFIIPDNLTPLLLKTLTLTPRCVIDTGLQKVFFVRGSVEDNGDLGSPSITLLTGLSSQVSSSCRKPLFHGLLMTLVCWNLFNFLP